MHPLQQPGVEWWSRRVPPPGPLCLVHDTIYRHSCPLPGRTMHIARTRAWFQWLMARRLEPLGQAAVRKRVTTRSTIGVNTDGGATTGAAPVVR